MPAVQDLLNVARRELGTAENPPGSNDVKYTRWAGMVGQPWCDIFVSWCIDQAGMKPAEGFHAYTPEHYDAFRRRGRGWPGTAGIQPGDVVFYDFPGGPDRISHVGIVETVNPNGSFVAIEGNTDERGGRTGGKVMRQLRSTSVVGYGRPEYQENDAMTADDRAYVDAHDLKILIELKKTEVRLTERMKFKSRKTRAELAALKADISALEAKVG